jgi:hypothetical protein
VAGQAVIVTPRQHSGWRRDIEWERAAAYQYESWPQEVDRPLCWRRNSLAAMVGFEPVDGQSGDRRWHISVSHKSRVPTWEEMVRTAHDLRPGVVFVIGVPPRSMWMNVHPNVLHLWEVRDRNLIAQWRFEGRGDAPT